ncbi:hypothetical protein [Bradyrhizobium sp. Ai1a-2]|nr:hypothetical protein [Bradyrhizobium sp. Ai1a-2]
MIGTHLIDLLAEGIEATRRWRVASQVFDAYLHRHNPYIGHLK